MDALVPVVIGGLIALVGGLIGAGIQGRREHRKWLREKRLDAYIPTIAFLTEYELFLVGLADHRSRVEGVLPSVSDAQAEQLRSNLAPEEKRGMEYRERVSKELAAVTVLGPEDLAEAARQWEEASRTSNGNPYVVSEALKPMLAQMRKAVGIND